MTTVPPNPSKVLDLAAAHGFDITEQDAESFSALMEGTLASHNAVDALSAANSPTPPEGRTFTEPAEQDNPLGAWAAKSEIQTRTDGPLAGKRVVIKDNTAVAGLPMRNGSATLEGFVPSVDATVVSRLLDAGAIIAGKSVCEDLCFSGGSHTAASGPTRNPWDPTRTSGGSSSGSGALVASREVDMAIGGDQGGSIRIPSAFCGCVGLKPTHGLVPYTGAFPIETTIDHLGPITQTVADAALMLEAIAGPDGNDPRQVGLPNEFKYADAPNQGIDGMRIGVLQEGFGWEETSEPGVDETVRAAAQRLTEAGATVTDVSLPLHRDGVHIWNVIAVEGAASQMVRLNGYGMNYKGLYDPELIQFFSQSRIANANDLSETVKLVAMLGAYLTETHGGAHYARAQNLSPMLTAAYDSLFEEVDAIVMPTLPMVATQIPASDAPREDYVARALEMIPNTAPFDVSGHPALSVPAGLSEGLPVGMMIVAPRFADSTALRVGGAWEKLVGGFPAPQGG